MIFHADSESDLKTIPNQVKYHILSKIRFLWYFDLKKNTKKNSKKHTFPLKHIKKHENQNFKNSWHFRPKILNFFGGFKIDPRGPWAHFGPPGGPRAPPGVKNKEKLKKSNFHWKTPKRPKIKISKIVETSGPKFWIFLGDFKSIPGVPGPNLGPLGGPKIGQNIPWAPLVLRRAWAGRRRPHWGALGIFTS